MTHYKIKFWLTNKNGEVEEFEETREEWSMEIAIGKTLRNARATVFKGRRDVNNLNVEITKLAEELEAPEIMCGKCGGEIEEKGDGFCNKCFNLMSIQ